MTDSYTDLAALFRAQSNQLREDLSTFVSIASVSTDPDYEPEMSRAAAWLQNHLRTAGAEAELIETPGHPVVLGRYYYDPKADTYLIYGHYDVQPPDPLAAWRSPPFELTEDGGRLYGRGVSDDKAPLLIALAAFGALRRQQAELPNLLFILEGEEEIGSPNLATVVRRAAGAGGLSAVLSADGAMWRADIPTLTTRSRGLVGLEVVISGPHQDLHSGRHGGAVRNPVSAAAELVAGFHDETGRVAVEGFYDDVIAPSTKELEGWRALPYDDDAYAVSIGVPNLWGEAQFSTLERLWSRPTLEVNGFYGGYQGPGSKTVIPHQAAIKLTCRLVHDQDPDRVAEAVKRHISRHIPAGVRVDVTKSPHAARAYVIAETSPLLTAAGEILTGLYHQPVRHVGMGGTLPICETFQRELSLDTLFFSFAVADENIHAPNEFFRSERLEEGFIAWAQLLMRLGAPDYELKKTPQNS